MNKEKFRFTCHWIKDEEKFLVTLWRGDKKQEEFKTDSGCKVFGYIQDTMCGLLLMGEDWYLTY